MLNDPKIRDDIASLPNEISKMNAKEGYANKRLVSPKNHFVARVLT